VARLTPQLSCLVVGLRRLFDAGALRPRTPEDIWF